jgi:hypothetical protein
MRVYLTKPELDTDVGQELLRLCLEITEDGKLDLEEIKALRRWLRANKDCSTVAAVPYLHDIMKRITADGVIDRDELLELHLAVERVIPTAHRTPAIQARQKREAERRERRRERRQIEREREQEEQKRLRAEDRARAMRLRHAFSKVAGVTFPNDDGSERQQIIGRCSPGEQLVLQHDPHNKYSSVAIRVLRINGEQLGHAPEYMAERIVENIEDGCHVLGVLSDVTGGTREHPTLGANFAVFFVAKDVPNDELTSYINDVLVKNAR